MSYDDPTLKEFAGYFKAKEPGRRERADAWATAIGLQKVDGLSTSRFLVETAKDHIEGKISQAQARRRIRDYYAAKDENQRPDPSLEEAFFRNLLLGENHELKSRYLLIGLDHEPPRFKMTAAKSGKKKAVRKSGKKTSERVLELLSANPRITFEGMVATLQITRSTIQKHIASNGLTNEKFEIRYENENIWMSQKMLAAVYGVDLRTVSYHIAKLFKDAELDENSVIQKYWKTADDGKKYNVNHRLRGRRTATCCRLVRI